MRSIAKFVVLAGILCSTSQVTYGDVIYSNLGPGGSFSSLNGWTIGYPFGPNEVGQSFAFSFTPTNDFSLESVDLAIGNGSSAIGGASNFIVGIYTDASNMPGSILTSASGIAPLTASYDVPPSSTTRVFFPGSTILSKGTQYWIGVHPAAAQPTDLAWWWNSLGLQSQAWFSNTPSKVFLGGPWEGTAVRIESAYQVNGTVVPSECDFSSEPGIERCFGGIGDKCKGIPIFAPFSEDENTCLVSGWMAVGSILHDRCCIETNNTGVRCANPTGTHLCSKEWKVAVDDTLCNPLDNPGGATRKWPSTFGPYHAGNTGDCPNLEDCLKKDLRAPVGARVNPKYESFCPSGRCQVGMNGKTIIKKDQCGRHCECQ